uniref:ATP synthase F0 subunit 8 n=1 Tax=Elateroidea sp. 5 KM-2017 TaxID=2219428 RepID=A0A346RK39_9COLE|nr:ATP synthase F0 subunit 8 [Elateroidea sp. 5 KM-2017]
MPQMSPMMWTLILINSMFLILMLNCLMFFLFKPKNFKIKSINSYLIWKW